MSHDSGQSNPYSFGETPSDRVRLVDHQSWWETFMELVGTQPEAPELTRLSDDPVHVVHGRIFSIWDCAMKAIEAARAEGEERIAENYLERAEKLIRSYDRQAASRIRRFYDHRMTRSLLTSAICLTLAVFVSILYFKQGQSSNGLLVIISLFVVISLGCAAYGAYSMRKKRYLLRLDYPRNEKPQERIGTSDGKTKK